jgi:Cytochrome c oxidase assembly protein PET191
VCLCLCVCPGSHVKLGLTAPVSTQIEGKSATECGKEVEECQGLRQAYYQCKRGQIDNTKRIRGNKGY